MSSRLLLIKATRGKAPRRKKKARLITGLPLPAAFVCGFTPPQLR